ncbi:transposase family protein (plasmid) [Azospirillum brasilense]|nr:transposase family protein [Azospirillum brasilense]
MHSRYERRLADLPWQGRPVILRLQARRFLCREAGCPKRTFAERLPGIVQPSARRSEAPRRHSKPHCPRPGRGSRRAAGRAPRHAGLRRHPPAARHHGAAHRRPGTWARPSCGGGILAPYLEHLEHRWAEGQRNATALWREIGGRGFAGSRSTVRAWTTNRRRRSPDTLGAGPSKADTWGSLHESTLRLCAFWDACPVIRGRRNTVGERLLAGQPPTTPQVPHGTPRHPSSPGLRRLAVALSGRRHGWRIRRTAPARRRQPADGRDHPAAPGCAPVRSATRSALDLAAGNEGRPPAQLAGPSDR